jgi:tripartite-type tricarboxylate transporter receptor subunit TctC
LSNVPTWAEMGEKGTFENWRGVIGAGGITKAQTAYWEGVLRKVAESDEFQKFAAKNQWVVDFRGAAETKAFMKEASGDLKAIMDALGFAK